MIHLHLPLLLFSISDVVADKQNIQILLSYGCTQTGYGDLARVIMKVY
jgi:hypothetical protein